MDQCAGSNRGNTNLEEEHFVHILDHPHLIGKYDMTSNSTSISGLSAQEAAHLLAEFGLQFHS